MNIVLTGFMGTGKSAVGKLLAEKLGWQFLDTDELIEKEVKINISDIFAYKGEPYFRNAETHAIKLVSLLDKTVISCGGGAVLKEENMEALEKNGKIVCLTATPQAIFERVKSNKDRPLLQGKDPLSKITNLLEKRAPYYKRCDISIDTTSLSVEEVVNKLIEYYKATHH